MKRVIRFYERKQIERNEKLRQRTTLNEITNENDHTEMNETNGTLQVIHKPTQRNSGERKKFILFFIVCFIVVFLGLFVQYHFR
jgi:hypothetical protein